MEQRLDVGSEKESYYKKAVDFIKKSNFDSLVEDKDLRAKVLIMTKTCVIFSHKRKNHHFGYAHLCEKISVYRFFYNLT